MDVHNTIGGSLQISTEVIAKIARLAALEVDGVSDVATGTSQNVRSLLGRTGLQKPVTVVMEDGIATVTVHITVVYGSKVMPLCEKVQENVKQAIQNILDFFLFSCFYDSKTVIPMYSIMPIMSLVMEINGPVAMAGSTFSFSKVMGTSVPKMEANMTTAKRLMETE